MAWIREHSFKSRWPNHFNIHAIADWQLGSASTDLIVIRRKVREIRDDPQSVWVFLGDVEDDDRPSTRARRRASFADRQEVPAADAKKHRVWIEKEVLPIMEPLTKRPCLGILAGHHWTQLERGVNSAQYICNALTALKKEPVPYIGQMSAWIWLSFERSGTKYPQSVKRLLHVQHGAGGGQAVGSALKKLDIASHRIYADAYIRAHSCALEATKYDVVRPRFGRLPIPGKNMESRKFLQHRTVPLLNVGAATRAYDIGLGDPSYTEEGMMRPLTLGWGILKARLRRELDIEGGNFRVDWNIEI